MTKQTLEDVAGAILPLCFASEFAEAPLGVKGSCFLVRRHGVLWLVTAKHAVVGDRGHVRVPRNEDSLEWLELGASSTMDPLPHVEDTAFADLLVFRVLSSGSDVAPAIDLDTIAVADQASPGDQVWLAGYPANSNTIDYSKDSRHFNQQRHRIRASYDAPDPSSRWMHVILLWFLEATDGMSGSPVFLKHKQKWSFAGVLTRAGGGSWSWARFVAAELLLHVLDAAWKRETGG